jgi:hypothetical protein
MSKIKSPAVRPETQRLDLANSREPLFQKLVFQANSFGETRNHTTPSPSRPDYRAARVSKR